MAIFDFVKENRHLIQIALYILHIIRQKKGSVENDQHQKMINIVHSENNDHIYFGNNFEENDHHGKVKK